MDSEHGPSGSALTGPLRQLVAMVPPPSAGTIVDWDAVGEVYPHGFPDDYRQFMCVYGEGVFDSFINVDAPISEVYPNDPGMAGETANAKYAAEEQDFGSPDLLIGWGATVDADILCWLANDPDPNRWTTIIWRRHWAPPESWQIFDCGMVELLGRYVRREIPNFNIPDLRYEGSRFIHLRDI